MPFELAKRYGASHLIVQPADLLLDPPESYFYVQDGFIVSCGVLYILCYFFYMMKTFKDKTCAGPVEYLGTTMAYELFYAFKTTSTTFELLCFCLWFLFDATFAAVAVTNAYPKHDRGRVVVRMIGIIGVGIAILGWLCTQFPDDREQVTAFWAGVALQLPISVGSVWLLIRRQDTKGHSLEIWITRYLGCYTAYGLFFWRYLNAPQNWSYVASSWSIFLIGLTLLAETVYPFVYVVVWSRERQAVEKQIGSSSTFSALCEKRSLRPLIDSQLSQVNQ